MFGSNNPLKLKAKFNATIKNSGFEFCTWFYVIDNFKTGNLQSKNTAEKLQILQIKGENINAVNSKCLGNLNDIEKYKAIFMGICSTCSTSKQRNCLQSEAEIARKTY